MIDRSSIKSIRNSVIAALIVAAILWAVSFFPAVWQPIKASASEMADWLTSEVRMPVWTFLVLLALAVPTVVGIISKKLRNRRAEVPTWRDYVEDSFEGMKWRWEYTADNSRRDLRAFCPADDTVLIHYYDGILEEVHYVCETCNRRFGPIEGDELFVLGKIERQIDRKVRTGDWSTVIADA